MRPNRSFISTLKFRNEKNDGSQALCQNIDEIVDWSMRNRQTKAKEIFILTIMQIFFS